MKWLPFILVAGALAGSCRPLQKVLPGTYVDCSLGDTLELSENNGYGYTEKLMNGISGWTEGTWQADHRDIRFIIQPRPLMGFALKISKDAAADHTIFRLFLGDSNQPVTIESLTAFKNHSAVPAAGMIVSGNTLELIPGGADSIEIGTADFRVLPISISRFSGFSWTLHLYPAERYYLLDNYIFRYKQGVLKNIPAEGASPVNIRFERIKNISKTDSGRVAVH